ncbi:ABC transporter substrate-binding protein [Chengkuizengella axinellae]|uniref:Extracellular solute-binding protein n=1 Tax=Chengkuizengella axinellae TaxID=3064388 RepID=A0ABT9IUL1_9BACL|nr:extracellular solute-binding protein [Chengkuizengella sp. 2205SS18-9]MDP5272997.1 extracellular solute-binding protein [Chengkuizengella sp. 2205SS18-9]
MKKISLMIFVLIVFATMLSACGGDSVSNNSESTSSNNSDSGQSNASNETETVTLELYTWLKEHEEHWTVLLEEFNKEYPHIKINLNNDWGTSELVKVDLAAASQQPMDIITLPNSESYSQRLDMFLPLDEFINEEGMNYDEEYKVSTKINDQYYALPGRLQIWFVLMNKEKLDQAGLEVPKEWTWDEFMEYAKVLTSGEGADKEYGTFFHKWVNYFTMANLNNPINNILVNDGKAAIDTDRVRKSLEITYQLQNEDKTAPPYAEIISQKMSYRNYYFQGKSSIMPIGSFMIQEAGGTEKTAATFKSAFAPYPKFSEDDENGLTYGGIDYVGVAANSKHPKEAYEFIRWYTTKGMSIAGNLSSWKKADLDQEIEGILANATHPEMVDLESLKYVMDISIPAKISPTPEYYTEVNERYISEVEKFLLNKQDLDTTIKNAEKAVTDIINANQ